MDQTLKAIELLEPFIDESVPWSREVLIQSMTKIEKHLLSQYPNESEKQLLKRFEPYKQAFMHLASLPIEQWPKPEKTTNPENEMDSFPYFRVYENESVSPSKWYFPDLDGISWIVGIISIGVILFVMWIGANQYFQ